MILDILENGRLYAGLHGGFAQAFQFLSRTDLTHLELGRHEIDGDKVYALVAREPGRKKKDAELEVHEKYIDIQLVLEGTDEMGWRPKSSCTQPSCDYDPEKDFQLFADEPDAWIRTKPGVFAIFFPEDAHMPLISSGELHKVVVKVEME